MREGEDGKVWQKKRKIAFDMAKQIATFNKASLKRLVLIQCITLEFGYIIVTFLVLSLVTFSVRVGGGGGWYK